MIAVIVRLSTLGLITMRKKAISVVIATVILISVAVALGVAVSFWESGLTGTLSKFEKLEMRSAYSIYTPANSTWTIILSVTNTGRPDATINSIMINGKPYTTYPNVTVNSTQTLGTVGSPISILTGQTKSLYVNIPQASGFISGQTIELSLVTTSDTNYPKVIVLA